MARHLIPIHRRNIISDPYNFLRQEIDRLFETNTNVGITQNLRSKKIKKDCPLQLNFQVLQTKILTLPLRMES